ncbi:winged helix-turn-helix domain-containing protein [Halomicroarcula sp. GCM10025710]
MKTIRQTPDLSGARSVVGLDAHPAMPLWRLNSVEHIERAEILDTDERRFWRLFERGLFAVQVGDATRPLSGDKAREWLGEEKLDVLLDDLVDEGLETAITTTQVERKLASLLSENGVLNPETMHYGEVRSRNDFGDEDVGFVNGCMDPGDGFVLTVLCEYECDAEPEQTECAGCSGKGCEECDETGHRRARGRGFTGPDAATAGAILASVRENEVAQAAGRYARNADDPDDRAVVYVRTDATPTGFADVQVGGVEWIATRKQVRIVESLQSDDWLSAKQIAADLDVSKRHVLKTLKKLRDQGVVDCRKGEGPYGADLYRSITGKTTSHLTDLGPSLSQGCELDGSMWSLIVEGADTVQQNAVYSSPEPDELSGGALGQFTSPPARESVDTVSENITAFDRVNQRDAWNRTLGSSELASPNGSTDTR